MTRTRNGVQGYARSMFHCGARITLDGEAINREFKVVPVDYFGGGRSLGIKDVNPDYETYNKEGQQQAESEERLLSNKSHISAVGKYISRIDVLETETDANDMKELKRYCRVFNIFIYKNKKDFQFQKNGTQLL